MTIKDIIAGATGEPFTRWLHFELLHECEYFEKHGALDERTIRTENVEGDSGGLTFAGVDRASHAWFDYGNPTVAAVLRAYQADWDAVKAGQLREPVGAIVANFGVNAGSRTAIKLLQQALGVNVDGEIGPVTLAAANGQVPQYLASQLIAQGDKHYQSLAANSSRLRKFLGGWLSRDQDMRDSLKDL